MTLSTKRIRTRQLKSTWFQFREFFGFLWSYGYVYKWHYSLFSFPGSDEFLFITNSQSNLNIILNTLSRTCLNVCVKVFIFSVKMYQLFYSSDMVHFYMSYFIKSKDLFKTFVFTYKLNTFNWVYQLVIKLHSVHFNSSFTFNQ